LGHSTLVITPGRVRIKPAACLVTGLRQPRSSRLGMQGDLNEQGESMGEKGVFACYLSLAGPSESVIVWWSRETLPSPAFRVDSVAEG